MSMRAESFEVRTLCVRSAFAPSSSITRTPHLTSRSPRRLRRERCLDRLDLRLSLVSGITRIHAHLERFAVLSHVDRRDFSKGQKVRLRACNGRRCRNRDAVGPIARIEVRRWRDRHDDLPLARTEFRRRREDADVVAAAPHAMSRQHRHAQRLTHLGRREQRARVTRALSNRGARNCRKRPHADECNPRPVHFAPQF
jgi:hypothetical protein